MKKTLISSILLVFLTLSCARCGKDPTQTAHEALTSTQFGEDPREAKASSPNPTILSNDSVPFNGTRIIFLHGFRDNITSYQAPAVHHYYAEFFKRLTDSGYQILMFNYKYTKPEFFADGGTEYRGYFKKLLEDMLAFADKEKGPATKTIIGGFSFGGLHALMSQAMLPTRFTAVFAMLPVIKMSVLNAKDPYGPGYEMQGVDAPQFNPMNELAQYQTIPMHLGWGTADMRVDYRYTIQLKDALLTDGKTNLSYKEYAGLDHSAFYPNDDVTLKELETWIKSQ